MVAPDTRSRFQFLGIFIILIILISFFRIVGLITDYMWFKEMGYEKIFLVSFEAAILLFIVAFLAAFIFLAANLWISTKFTHKNIVKISTKLLISLLIAYIIGTASSMNWLLVLQYFRQVAFGLADPIFQKDISFYIFSLPFLSALWKFSMAVVVITLILVTLDYFQSMITSMFKQPFTGQDMKTVPPAFDFRQEMSRLKKRSIAHILILVTAAFALVAARHYLSSYAIMYSESGIVVGAGYTDVMVLLPAIRIMIIAALLMALFAIIWIFFFKSINKKYVLYAVAGYFILSFLGLSIVPGLVQSLRVSPNEINLEKPYIENNIKFTRIAYGLDSVQEEDFDVKSVLTAGEVEGETETIENIRILDWRPLTTTYKQTQEIRLYYDLSEIDIDRYDIGGKYRQVMIAPRELDQSKITANAQTWVNLHLIYTHGYGIVMSPVNTVTEEGLPNYIIKDIPPVVDYAGLEVTRPEIYYGAKDNNYVIVNTNQEEFDYPKGETNQNVRYAGSGGLKLDSFLKKFLMAARFTDIKILLSGDITQDSRIMFYRNIQERISTITPFLVLDKDPYLVLSEGKLYWIQDAYTVSGNFPYSQKLGGINYMRNSVKVVVDAYEGDVTYYIMDKKDPIIMTYAKIFPGEFKYFSDMPEGLKAHIRYPEDLFSVQSEIYRDYHMRDPTVFYNKEDAWQIPNEIYGTGQQVMVEPYYIIMKLPGEEKEEFVLMTSFTPTKKDNMIGWLAARMDGENYGRLLLFRFPKDKLVYGPLQIEAKIDQDSVISQQLTLWGQQGSRVTRGNLLVIPIGDSLLYVEPLYLQSEQGQLPEMKRVIVSDGEKVVMEQSLGLALERLLGIKAATEDDSDKTTEELIQQADRYYSLIQKSMQEGNWSAIGENIEKLGETIDALKER